MSSVDNKKNIVIQSAPMKKTFRGQGVKGRAVMWQGSEWIVAQVYGHRDDFLELRRGDCKMGMVLRAGVKFVRHNYEARP